jgi:DNA-binding FadR family transcriptional regulator
MIEHRAIVNAVTGRDAAEARRAVRKHITNVRKVVDDIVIAD